MFPFRCKSQIDELDSSEKDEELPEGEANPEDDEEDNIDDYGLGLRQRSAFCAAFTLLDTDGDGLLPHATVKDLIAALSRELTQENMDDVASFYLTEGCDGETGLDFDGFYKFLASQLVFPINESELREAFGIFGFIHRMDDPVPEGYTDMVELRHYLKRGGLKLTDEEIDYLWNEEDNWLLEDRRIETELLIKKLLEDPLRENTPEMLMDGRIQTIV